MNAFEPVIWMGLRLAPRKDLEDRELTVHLGDLGKRSLDEYVNLKLRSWKVPTRKHLAGAGELGKIDQLKP